MVPSAPHPPALFVGRESEQARCVAAAEDLRLIAIYGVAGVGKTALMIRAGEELATRVGGRLVYRRCRPGESVATVARSVLEELAEVASGAGPEPQRCQPRNLVTSALERPLIVCLDDAHRVNSAPFVEELVELAARHLPLWFLVASRADLGFDPVRLDHLVLRLQGLSAKDAERLWRQLGTLYGPSAVSLADLMTGATVSPLLLKQAFNRVSSATDADPMGLRELEPFETEILLALTTYRRPIPLAALAEKREHSAVVDALRALTRRFLVESCGTDQLTVHDLVRDAVGRSLSPSTLACHRRCLAYYQTAVRQSPHDEELELEVLHHALACGEDSLAREILLRISLTSRLIPVGAVAERELNLALEALAARGALPARLRLLRARLAGRRGALPAPHEEVQLASRDAGPSTAVDMGEIAYLMGRLDECLSWLRLATARADIDVTLRAWATVLQVAALRHRGELASAQQSLAAERDSFDALGTLGAAMWAVLHGMLCYEEEALSEADACLGKAKTLLAQSGGTGGEVPVLPSLHGATVARLGRLEATSGSEIIDHSLFFRLAARICRAEELLYRGDARGAAALTETAMTAAREAGYPVVELAALSRWAEAARILGEGERAQKRLGAALTDAALGPLPIERHRLRTALTAVLLDRGRVAQADALAREALQEVRGLPGTRSRLQSMAAAATATRGDDAGARALLRRRYRTGPTGYDDAERRLTELTVLQWRGRQREVAARACKLGERAVASGWRWLECRARLFEAEARYHLGELDLAATLTATAGAQCEEGGYALEAAQRGLLEGALARSRGEAQAAAAAWQQARSHARRSGLPVQAEAAGEALKVLGGRQCDARSLGGQLARRLYLTEPVRCRLRTGNAAVFLTEGHAAALDDAGYQLYVDLVTGRLRSRRRWVNLAGHGTLVAVLAALLESPGEQLDQAELMARAWHEEFHAVRHRARVPVAVSRLRRLVGERLIPKPEAGTRGQYWVNLPESWAILEPLAPDAVPTYPI